MRLNLFFHRKLTMLWLPVIAYAFTASTGFAQGDVCPDFLGNTEKRPLSTITTTNHQYLYPVDVPPGAPGGSVGGAIATSVAFTGGPYAAGAPSTRTIVPTVNGIQMGMVVLEVIRMGLEDDAVISIYEGMEATGEPIDRITALNQAGKIGVSHTINGPVTITFSGQGSTGGDWPANVIRATTGDRLYTSCVGRTVALWEESIIPGRYIVIDDIEDNASGQYMPVCMARFDQDKNLIDTELSFCLDREANSPSLPYWYYPGEISFALDVETREISDLTKARILYLINRAKADYPGDWATWSDIQVGIWELREGAGGNEFRLDAIAAIDELPDPAEPTPFMITASGPAKAVPGEPVNLTITFEAPADPSASRNLKLIYPEWITVSVVSGAADLEDDNILIPSAQVIQLRLTSEDAGKASLQAVYEDDDYYNVQNLNSFIPCVGDIQTYLHVGTENPIYPFRSIDVEWDSSLPVSLVSFTAGTENNTVSLNWSVSNETDFSHFEVQKSSDAQNWRHLAKVAGNNTGKYGAIDHEPIHNTVYYRLKMVDLDGSFEYSKMESISSGGQETLLYAYPNPATSRLFLKNFSDGTELSLYNTAGQIVTHSSVTVGGVDVGKLKPGLYIAVIRAVSGEQVTQKIVIN